MVLVVPVLLLVIGVVINAALWYHGSQVATSAAQEGLRAARAANGSIAAGQKVTDDFVAQLGSSVVVQPLVEVTRDQATTTVSIHARSVAVVPGFSWPIEAKASAPTEGFRAP